RRCRAGLEGRARPAARARDGRRFRTGTGWNCRHQRRRLHLELGFASTFASCTDYLGLSKGSTFRRLTPARLLVQLPVVPEYLANGRLWLPRLVELRAVLCDQTLVQTLDRAAGKTEEDVKVLVAALRPQPAPPDLLRRLPVQPSPQPQLLLAPVEGDAAGS